LFSFPFLKNLNKNKSYHIVQKIEKLKLKIKNFKNDQIKSKNYNYKKIHILVASFCLLLIVPKTTFLKKKGEGVPFGKHKQGATTCKRGTSTTKGAKGTFKKWKQQTRSNNHEE
jgi:hypothetical protein